MKKKEAGALTFDKILYILYSVLLLITPLLFSANTSELFEFPKMFFIYFIGTTIIFVFLLKKIWLREKISVPINAAFAFVAAHTISTIFSMHKFTSVWGYFTRWNGGLVSVLVFFGIYITAINTFTKNEFKNLLIFVMGTLLPIGFYGIFQHFGIISNMWKSDPQIRIFSTFGQPNWLAAYVTTIIPLILIYIVEDEALSDSRVNAKDDKAATKNHRALEIITYAIAFATIWFTYSMSGLLGFATGIFVFIYLYRQKILEKDKLKALATLFAISILIAALNPGIFKQRASDAIMDLKNFISLQRKAHASDEYNIADSGNIRKHLWKGTLNLIFSSPKNLLFGTGPETFPYAFQKFRLPELNYTSEWNIIFNKPHNYYLELLANLGLAGFIPYLFIIKKSLSFKKSLIPSFAAFYMTNLFGWPTVATSLLFWFFLAYLEAKDA